MEEREEGEEGNGGGEDKKRWLLLTVNPTYHRILPDDTGVFREIIV